MGIFKKKQPEKFDPKKKVPVRPIKDKNPTMWCRKHECSKLGCPGGMHN